MLMHSSPLELAHHLLYVVPLPFGHISSEDCEFMLLETVLESSSQTQTPSCSHSTIHSNPSPRVMLVPPGKPDPIGTAGHWAGGTSEACASWQQPHCEPSSRGSRSIFSPDSKVSGGIIGHVRPKKSVPNPNFTPTQESPTLTPVPPLAKIGHQLYHGGGSISSDMVLTKKRPCQWITYPLGSTLTRAFLLMCCFR